MVKCPKCKQDTLRENISFDGALFWVKKVITSYCICGYRNTIRLPSSLTEKQNYEEQRNING